MGKDERPLRDFSFKRISELAASLWAEAFHKEIYRNVQLFDTMRIIDFARSNHQETLSKASSVTHLAHQSIWVVWGFAQCCLVHCISNHPQSVRALPIYLKEMLLLMKASVRSLTINLRDKIVETKNRLLNYKSY